MKTGPNRHCETCRYWHDPYSESFGRQRGSEAEERIQWGACGRVNDDTGTNSSRSFESSKLAYVVDASMYAATLYTRAEFGCVEWEPSEDGAS